MYRYSVRVHTCILVYSLHDIYKIRVTSCVHVLPGTRYKIQAIVYRNDAQSQSQVPGYVM